MMKSIPLGLLLLCAGGMAAAAPASTTAKSAPAAPKTADAATTPSPAPAGDAAAGGSIARTDVIGSQEAPTVFNVVPWKDKASRLPKKEITTSILRETLQPLDPDVLRREIELQQRLGDTP